MFLLSTAARAGLAAPSLSYPDNVPVLSRSGQFTARCEKSYLSSPRLTALSTNQNYLHLEPTLVTVSCERIKQLLLRELQAPDGWQGRVQLILYPAQSDQDPVTLTSVRYRDGWQYQVQLPTVIDRVRFVRTLVQTLLLERANRGAGTRAAELPAWLTEGLTQQLLAANEKEIILPPPSASSSGANLAISAVNTRNQNALATAHTLLSRQAPLSFEELSWPEANQWEGADGELYRCNAQLFVHELLAQPEGASSLRKMLDELPRYYNWQTAFLQAFNASFQRPLDVEKWWTLHAMHFIGRDLTQTWQFEESWQKLDEALQAPIEVRTGLNEMPLHSSTSLQTVLREWDRGRQDQVLGTKVRELELLCLRMAPPLVGLTVEYHETLATYLAERDRAGLASAFSKSASWRHAGAVAIQRLNDLDLRRKALRPAAATATPNSKAGAESPTESGDKPQTKP